MNFLSSSFKKNSFSQLLVADGHVKTHLHTHTWKRLSKQLTQVASVSLYVTFARTACCAIWVLVVALTARAFDVSAHARLRYSFQCAFF